MPLPPMPEKRKKNTVYAHCGICKGRGFVRDEKDPTRFPLECPACFEPGFYQKQLNKRSYR